jgi:hypothetical protein
VNKVNISRVANVVFWTQMAAAIIFAVAQVIRMMSSVEGLTITVFLFNLTFVILNLALAVRADQVQASRETKRAKWVYVIGTITYFMFIFVMIAKAETLWDKRDTIASTAVLIGVSIVLIRFRFQVALPMVCGWLALAMKAIPQLILAWKVWHVGGAGLSPIMMVMFHYLTLSRIFQISLIVKEAGWDKNRIALAVSEIGNELSWVIVTAVWLIRL